MHFSSEEINAGDQRDRGQNKWSFDLRFDTRGRKCLIVVTFGHANAMNLLAVEIKDHSIVHRVAQAKDSVCGVASELEDSAKIVGDASKLRWNEGRENWS